MRHHISHFFFFALLLWAGEAVAASPSPGAVLTWHDDNFRTGWQQQETILTPSTIGTIWEFRIRWRLKDQVDAQPLVIPSFINGHDIVFVADESNNVYQIDASTGAILKQVNLGAPVPRPLSCGNSGPNVGINSTPVIDWASQTLFVITYVNVGGTTPTYFLHALDLISLEDKVPPAQGRRIAYTDQWRRLYFQRDEPTPAGGAALRQWQSLRRFHELLRLSGSLPTRQVIARLAFGMELERNDSHGAPGKPAQRQATKFAGHLFLGHNLDVRRRPRE